MSQQKSKAEILESIRGSFNSAQFSLLFDLLRRLVTDERYANDVVDEEELRFNQGKIQCCFDIARCLGFQESDFKE